MSDANALTAWAAARAVIEHDITTAPRSLQVALGPSEIGNACDRCLIHRLAGTPEAAEVAPPWLPYVGTAVHSALEVTFMRHVIDRLGAGVDAGDEWLTETAVNVGDLRGQPVIGHADLFHVPTGTVIDFKVTGSTTLKKVRADGSGASLTYQRQIHLYGRGLAARGYPVRSVAIAFLPRNGMTLAQTRLFTAPYDEQVAIDALARAGQFATWLDLFGADAVLAGAAPHTGHEFTCDRMPDAAGTHRPPSGLDGLIATA